MSIWNLAEKHECFEATELALKHALDILRFDVQDNLKVKNLIVFLFLNLGKFEIAYSRSCTKEHFQSCFQKKNPINYDFTATNTEKLGFLHVCTF